jgi:hypothetical protein
MFETAGCTLQYLGKQDLAQCKNKYVYEIPQLKTNDLPLALNSDKIAFSSFHPHTTI